MNIVYCTLDPILSLRLPDYDLSDTVSGLVYGVMPLSFMISTLLFPYIVPKRVPHRVTLITSLFGLSFSQLLVGPFFEELNLASMIAGLSLSGFM